MSLNKRLMSSGPPAFVASENFNVVTYSGNGQAGRAVSVGFKPDIVWIKARNNGNSWVAQDSSRGVNSILSINGSGAELDSSWRGNYGQIASFTSTGFTVNAGSAASGNFNTSNVNYVAYCWKSGEGTTSTNTDGTNIDSTVQVNSDAGLSIATWTSTSSASDTIGHGLGSKPDAVLYKKYSGTGSWFLYTDVIDGSWDELVLNSNSAKSDFSGTYATSTTFKSVTSAAGANWLTYCFKNTDGFSKIATYTGNGSANGPIVETGFEPAFVLGRKVSGDNWWILDNKRNTTNPRNTGIFPNLSSQDLTGGYIIDFLSNGFQLKSSDNAMNQADNTYIYMAFAADPDTTAPTLADSFDIKTYSMSGGSDYDLSFNFRPQFVVTKTRDEGAHWSWNDVVRGADSSLASNDSNAVSSSHQWRVKDWFAGSTSVTIAQHASTGTSNVSYAWKADDNEPTITGGPAAAVYKFEDNANDVTGGNNGTAANVTYTSSGKFNKAAVFNGSSSKISLSAGSFRFRHLTISVWVKPAGSGHRCILDNYGTVGGASRGFIFRIDNSTGKARFVIYNGDCNYPYPEATDCSNVTAVVSTSAIATNAYTHIVITMNPDELKMYINGELDVSTQTQAIGYDDDSISRIGCFEYSGGAEQFYQGEIDQLRVYSGAITDTEVATLYAETAGDNDNLSLVEASSAVVSANPNAGFSIVKYEGTQGLQKIPHGLSAAPNMIIAKNMSNSGTSWTVFHSSLGAGKILRLENAADEITNDAFWGGTSNAPNATTFTVADNNDINAESGGLKEIIAYCFHDVSGYQKFGSYTGSGSTGNTVTVGFQPDFVMVKSSDEDEPWFVLDSKRDTSNPRDNRLMFDASNAEDDGSVHTIDFNSTNFVLNGTSGNGTNGSSKSYVYWAIKIN